MMKQILEWVHHSYKAFVEFCKNAFFANRVAQFITNQHIIIMGDTLMGEELQLTAHDTMPILDGDMPCEIAE